MNLHERGNAHVARGEWNEAAQCYRQAVAEQPLDAGAHVALGFVLMQLGDASAKTVLEKAIELDPSTIDGHYLLGTIARDSGDSSEAIARFREAVRRRPDFVEAHRDLVRLLVAVDPREAAAAAANAVTQFPQTAEFWFYRGIALEGTDDDAAIESYRRAVAIEPAALAVQKQLALILSRHKRPRDLLPHAAAWAALAPEDPDAHMLLGSVRTETHDIEGAIASYRRSLALRPHKGIEHILATLTGEGVPDRAPDEYVAQLFDGYAENFDSHLVQTLKYSTPSQLAMLLRDASPGPMRDVLDLGCGTGLMGAELANGERRLVGVDLSQKMLDRAREREIYARLTNADLGAMMREEPDCSYDLIVAADVFVYVGRLEPLFAQAYRLLRPSGLFAFSVEAVTQATAAAAAASGYALHSQGRYVHAKSYLEALAAASGFKWVELRTVTCRENQGVPVRAFLALLCRPD
jgi:predicted TPR repeat methyltransferase